MPSNSQPLQLIIYPSPLFAAHWALFLPTSSNPHLGTRIHADGSPLAGFTALFEPDYDLKACTQSYRIIELGAVNDVEEVERVAKGIQAPGKSLREAGAADEGKPVRRKIEVRNCQNWVFDVVGALVREAVLGEESLKVVEAAPKN